MKRRLKVADRAKAMRARIQAKRRGGDDDGSGRRSPVTAAQAAIMLDAVYAAVTPALRRDQKAEADRRRASALGAAKLRASPQSKAPQIREMLAAGEKVAVIAATLGVSERHVKRIKARG